MQGFMLRLDALVRRRQRPILVVWAILLVVSVPFALRQSEHLSSGGFDAPGSQSKAVADALARDFPEAAQAQLGVLLVPERGADLRPAIERVAAAVEGDDRAALAPAAERRALEQAGAGRPLVVPLSVEVPEDDAINLAHDLREELGVLDGAQGGVRTHLVGQGGLWAGMQDLSKEDLAQAETAGFPLVLLILLGVFGSLAAASLPLAMGLVSVLITGALIWLISQAMDMSVFVTNMASMVGIGVAVDYSLFVLARYREEIVAGHEPDAARGRAMATSGIAVLFSGVTVIVSLGGLWMINSNAVRSMGLGAILVVAVSLLASATLLPALMRAYGRRAYTRSRLFTVTGLIARSRRRRRPGSTQPGSHRTFWERWTEFITRRPVLAVVASAGVLLTLAIPTLSLEFGAGALRQFPEGYETRVGFETAAKLAGPGESSPVQVLVAGDGLDARIERVQERLRADAAVVRVAGVQRAEDGRSALVSAIARYDAESAEAKALVDRLRAALPDAQVGGVAGLQSDITDLISGSMWKVLLFVLGLSFLVLMILLRSIVLPLKAVLMNLLSVGAAYGVLVAVFQYGWIDGFLGFESNGYIDTLVPPLVLAVVFGLSMDYEVFLLSRIRERWEAHGDTRRAVTEGLSSSARTITSAALIMVSVFAVFVGTGVPSIKEIGLGSAVAIALDATLVRLILVPAAMELFGDWNWWLPRPIARLLPRSSFEQLPATT